MSKYRPDLKNNARRLRSNMTDAEQLLWYRIRRKQLLDIQFYRQRPIGRYIVDFYAPAARVVIEVDGSQHFEPEHRGADEERDANLRRRGLNVLRFDNLQVLTETDAVLEVIRESLEYAIRTTNRAGAEPTDSARSTPQPDTLPPSPDS